MKPTTTPTLEASIHGLAHCIAKIEPTDRTCFFTLLEALVRNPEQAAFIAHVMSAYEQQRPTAKVFQFKRPPVASRGA